MQHQKHVVIWNDGQVMVPPPPHDFRFGQMPSMEISIDWLRYVACAQASANQGEEERKKITQIRLKENPKVSRSFAAAGAFHRALLEL